MPELYEKELVRPGWYAADGGPTLITPDRINRWEKLFQQRRIEGFGFPTPWGHKLQAVPTEKDPYALDEQYARWNAGQMEWVEKRPNGRLYLMGTVPPGYQIDEPSGMLVNPKDGTVVRYVSPGWGDWVDGQGRLHQDELFHAALVTHPVQHEQEGFRRARNGVPAIQAHTGTPRFMSAGRRVTRVTLMALPMGKTMADKEEKDEKKGKKDDKPAEKPADDLPLDDLGGGDPLPDEPLPETTAITPENTGEPLEPVEPIAPEPEPADLGMGNSFTPEKLEQLKGVMSQLGTPLLPDTSVANVIDRLLTVLHMAATQGSSLVPSAGASQGQPLDLSMEGAQPDPMAPSAGGSGGMGMGFMSTRTGKIVTLDDSGRMLAENAAKSELAKIGAAWDKLAQGAPAAFKALCLQEKALASRFHMSLNPETGQVLCKAARARFNDMKRVLNALGHHKILGMMSRAVTPKHDENPAAKVKPLKPSTAPSQTTDADLQGEIARLSGTKPENVPIRRGQLG